MNRVAGCEDHKFADRERGMKRDDAQTHLQPDHLFGLCTIWAKDGSKVDRACKSDDIMQAA